ncbi:MAG: hypothetical protein ACE5LG_05085 [Anaerolineae bacterium]
MRHKGDEFDLWLSWTLREFVPDKDPPPRVWEAIEAKLAPGVYSGEVRPLPWRSKAGAWLTEVLSSVQALLLFLRFRLDEARVWAEEQSTPASVMISIYAAPWPLYSYREATLHCWWSLTPTIR